MTTPPPTRNDFRYWLELETRWGDMDALGHVNNAKFFTYDETVRLSFFTALMKDDPRFWKDYGLILAHIECDFIAQLKPPATLELGFRISKIGRTSMTTECGMFLGDRLMAITRGVLVWFDYKANASLPVPEDVKKRIEKRE